MNNHFDYIICGAGCAGLSLAGRLTESALAKKKVLVLDREQKDVNDRTWSFWTTKQDNRYQSIYKKSWDRLAFYTSEMEKISKIDPYSYHTIQALDFYKFNLGLINRSDNVTFLVEEVIKVAEKEDKVEVVTSKGSYTCDYVFDSIVKSFPEEADLFVWQHFLGWEVQLTEGSFDDSTATFMDFRIDQEDDTRFVYVLPFDKKNALVEATLFSKEIWTEERYEDILRKYMDKYIPGKYVIKKKEIGKIPMTTESFSRGGNRIIPLGTNNSTVKPSSGYAFTRIQKECDQIIKGIKNGKVRRIKTSHKYLSYDRTLLNVLLQGRETASDVFGMMFRRNEFATNLKFLDEKTSLFEEIRIFMTLPFWSFLKAFIQENVVPSTKL